MKFLSVCSGIEAAAVAWAPLGWKAWAFSEIEPFPCSLLAHHYPDVPNLGDMTKFQDWPLADEPIDLLCGGTPCQSFSVAGLRKGLDDPRGNLMLTYLAIADKYRPRWLVWENVPGVLSSNGGRDFGAFLGGLGQLGYGFAYRVFDAQYFGVAQRRRRVFVVGHLGDWRRAAAVLFERHSLQGHPAPRRETRQGVAGTLSARTQGGGGLGADFELGGGLIPERERALTTSNQRIDAETETLLVTHALRGEGFDASEDGTGRGTPLVLAFQSKASACNSMNPSDLMPTMDKGKSDGLAIAFDPTQITSAATRENPASGPGGIGVRTDNAAYTLEARSEVQSVQTGMQVRRLTPRECERLQGFPDDYTLTPHGRRINPEKLDADFLKYQLRGNPKHLTRDDIDRLAADGPRYKALGNSWAVPCARWIGERIAAVDVMDFIQDVAA